MLRRARRSKRRLVLWRVSLELLREYAAYKDLAASTVRYYTKTVKGFEKHLGRAGSVEDLHGDIISQYLLEKKGHVQDSYRRNIRNALKALQRYAEQPGRVCHVRVKKGVVVGNTTEELGKIRDASWRLDLMRGEHPNVPTLRSVYFRAWIQVMFESCLRPSDVHLIRRDRCIPGTLFDFQSAKTGEVTSIRLSDTACGLVRLLPEHELAVPDYVQDFVLRDWLAKCCEWAGVEYHARQAIRRTAGTAADIRSRGQGHIALGNTRAVFERHYQIKEQIRRDYVGPGEMG